jgi:hypothetical protein
VSARKGLCRYAATRSKGGGYDLTLTVKPGDEVHPLDIGELTLINVSRETAVAEVQAMEALGYEVRSVLRENFFAIGA